MGDPGRRSEADARYLDGIRGDVAAWLGPGAALLDLRIQPAGGQVRLFARYQLEGRERESAAEGETVYAAHVTLRATILQDRLRFGLEDALARR